MAIKSLLGSDEERKPQSQPISDEVLGRAKKRYYNVMAYCRANGIIIDYEFSRKVKRDAIEYERQMEF